ncbi:MAG: DNA cytosine methyltransferase [Pseudomonadota bacterium]
MRELSLFTGAGGGLLASHLLGWRPIGYVERDPYCQRVLTQRITDGLIPDAPLFGDIDSFLREGYARAYQGMVDVLTAGFPCQPFSVAGHRKGSRDERNAWPQTLAAIRQIQPRFAFLENVAGLLSHEYVWQIFADMAESGLDARWCVLGGFDVGAVVDGPRLWIIAATPDSFRSLEPTPPFSRSPATPSAWRGEARRAVSACFSRDDFTNLRGNPDALAEGVERLRAVGNGQIPDVAALAWQTLTSPNFAYWHDASRL